MKPLFQLATAMQRGRVSYRTASSRVAVENETTVARGSHMNCGEVRLGRGRPRSIGCRDGRAQLRQGRVRDCTVAGDTGTGTGTGTGRRASCRRSGDRVPVALRQESVVRGCWIMTLGVCRDSGR